MADTGKTTRMSERLRAGIMAQAGQPLAGYSAGSGSEVGSATAGVIQGIKNFQKTQAGTNTMGGSAGRTEDPYQAQRAGEREDMRQFGDDDEHLGIMGNSLAGSRTYTKKEVKKGYRKLKG